MISTNTEKRAKLRTSTMSAAKASVKRVSESENVKSNQRRRTVVDDDFDAAISNDIKGIMSALQQIKEKAQMDGQKKNEETISSVASEMKARLDELKSKLEKERQSFAKGLLKSSKECENLLKNETAKFQELFERFSKEKSTHLQALKDVSENNASLTGGAYGFEKATISLSQKLLSSPKKVTLLRHGLSSWNKEGRVQGSSDLSVLTEAGVAQAERCRTALSDMHFDQCFSSPISRAKSTAEILWQGREQPLVYLDSLKEAHLYFLEGLRNVDAKKKYPKEFVQWREDPSNFCINGVYPTRKLWETAREAWLEILFTPGENFLVVTHKSILRALICTAHGLPPERFRAIDVNNGGLSVFGFNKQGEAMLRSLNMTAHMYTDHVYHY
ncbi:Probable 2-carboxy-D-arabinitol-1-phosphatase [Striga hermonthica]|uniref:Probable 2-carboxy-D-arabinitol-1-phosphatase n=1 Tax=Striga hermonthica TaxID=68872 RepID=A0A9N7MYA2_STRHE|nr:Probable 2-carboxy-D-arabinitol-1-phosphatase [Striga hermonthica]